MDEPGLAGAHPRVRVRANPNSNPIPSPSSFSTTPIILSSVLFQTSLAGMTISGVVLDLVLLVILEENGTFTACNSTTVSHAYGSCQTTDRNRLLSTH